MSKGHREESPCRGPSRRYHYDLSVEIPATEVAVLVDAHGEALSLRERIGRNALRRQLEEQEIKLDVSSDERWPDFQRDIETLSMYLSEPISRLDVGWDVGTQALVDRGIDVEEARRRWKELPEWVRSSLTNQGAGPGGARG